MIAAFVLPRLLESVRDRTTMLCGGAVLASGLLSSAFAPGYGVLLALWLLLGIGYSLTQTPSGRLLRRSSNCEDLPALFASQFALSHACWLFSYPPAGWPGAQIGIWSPFLVPS